MEIEIGPQFSTNSLRIGEKGNILNEFMGNASESTQGKGGCTHKLVFFTFVILYVIVKKCFSRRKKYSFFNFLNFTSFITLSRATLYIHKSHKFSLVTFLSAKCCDVVHYVM